MAGIWLDSEDHAAVEAAANAIDAILSRPDAETAGTAVNSAALDVAMRAAVVLRSMVIPTGLRSLREGPIEVFYTAHPMDRQTKVWLVRLCAR